MLKLCLGFLVDTLFYVKWLARLSIFIHADILVLVSEFAVMVILSEWWLVSTTVGTSLPTVGTSLPTVGTSLPTVGTSLPSIQVNQYHSLKIKVLTSLYA